MRLALIFSLLLVAGAAVATSDGSVFYDAPAGSSSLPLSGGVLTGAVADSDCIDDGVAYDNNGVQGCGWTSDSAPQDLLVHPQDNYPHGTQTAADLILRGGIDEDIYTVADYSHVDCTAMTLTITVNGSASTCVEGTDWDAETSNAVTASNIATCVNAISGVSSTASAAVAGVQPDLTTYTLTLATDATNCVTTTAGTDGTVSLVGGASCSDDQLLCLGTGCDYWSEYNSSGSQFELWTTDADGGGSDGLVLSVDDGTDDLDVAADLVVGEDTYVERVQGRGSAPVTFGSSAATSHALNQFDVLINGDLEIEAQLYIDGGNIRASATSLSVLDDTSIGWGNSGDMQMRWDSSDAESYLAFNSTTFNGIVLIETADLSTDFGHANPTNPTLFIQSADATSTGDWISLSHNQTDAVIDAGNGGIKFNTQTVHAANVVTCATATDDFDIDWDDGNIVHLDMEDCDQDANDVNAPTNPRESASYTISIEQSAAGTEDLTWNAVFLFPGGTDPVLTQSANAIDVVSCVYVDARYLCSFGQDYQ